MGADGGIGCTYAAMPELYVDLYRNFKAGDFARAQEIQNRINKVIAAMGKFVEGNIIQTTKELMRLKGFEPGAATFPAKEFTAEKRKAFADAMEEAGFVR